MRKAKLVFGDGTRQEVAVEEANRLLSEHRHDPDWLSSLSHLEYSAPAPGLDAFEIWDTPGLGGNEENERVANEFIDRVTGALWVFDATLLGKASITGPLLRLKQTGKRVVAVLNQVDCLDSEDEIQRAVEYLKLSYPEIITEVVPLSATEAFDRAVRGEEDRRLAMLRCVLHRSILATAQSDRAERIRRTTEASAQRVADCIQGYHRDIADRLGFLQHTRENLKIVCQRLLDRLPEFTIAEARIAFQSREREELARLQSRFVKGGLERLSKAIERIDDPDYVLVWKLNGGIQRHSPRQTLCF